MILNRYKCFFLVALVALCFLNTTRVNGLNNYTISLDWSTVTSKIDSAHWGVSDYEIQTPGSVSDSGFVKFMQKIDPAFIRIHRSSLSNRYTDANTQTWDSAYVVECFESAKQAYGDAKIMFNPMPQWPDWMNESKVLSPEGEDKVIEMLAQMARIVKNSGIRVDYWEIFNERDEDYEDKNALNKYFALYNRAYDTIKTVIPDAKIGGLAFTHPKYEWITGFLDQCAGKYDFISWHNYSNGPNNKPNDSIMVTARPGSIISQAQGVINQLKLRGLEDSIETFLTEYNIQWSWSPIEERHANHIGAMFQASVVSRLAAIGVTGIAIWHNKGNAYGLINDKNEMRATGILYSWGNRYLAGERIAIINAPHRDKIEVIPILNHAKDSTVLLINKSSLHTEIPFDSLNIITSTRILTLDHHSFYPYPISVVNDTLTLPPMSVTLVTTQPAKDTIPPLKPELSGFSQLNSVTVNVSNLYDDTSFAGYKLFMDNEMYGFFSGVSTVNISGLEQGETYSFTAVSTDEEGNVSETSDVLVLTTKVDTTGPTIPSRLRSEILDQTHIKFTWNESLDNSGVSGYVIMINEGIIDTIAGTEYILDITGYSDANTFQVYAFDPHGNNSEIATLEFLVSGVNPMKIDEELIVYPNPMYRSSEFFVENKSLPFTNEKILLFNPLGMSIPIQVDRVNDHLMKIKTEDTAIANGYYFILVVSDYNTLTARLLLIN